MKVLFKVPQPHITLILSGNKTRIYTDIKSEHSGTVSILDSGLDNDLIKRFKIDKNKVKSNIGCIYSIIKLSKQKTVNSFDYNKSENFMKHMQIDDFRGKQIYYYDILKYKKIPIITYVDNYGEPDNFDNLFKKSSLDFEEAVMERNISDDFKSPITTVLKDKTSPLILECNWILSLNPYIGCEHNCKYCYVKATYGYNGMWTTTPRPAEFNEIRNIFYDGLYSAKNNLLANIIRKKAPIKIGVSTDPLQKIEEKYKVTLKSLNLLKEEQYPYIIITKGTLASKNEYLDVFDKSVSLYQQTITTIDDEIAKVLEPNAPLPSERLDTLKILNEETDIVTQARIEPIMPGITCNLDGSIDTEYYDKFLKMLHDIGIKHLMLRMYSKNPMTDRVIYEDTKLLHKLNNEGLLTHIHDGIKLDGIDYSKLYKDRYKKYGYSKDYSSNVYPEPIMYLRFTKQISEIAKKYDMTLSPRNCVDVKYNTSKISCCSIDNLSKQKRDIFQHSMNNINTIILQRKLDNDNTIYLDDLIQSGYINPNAKEEVTQAFKDGYYADRLIRANPIHDENGNVIGLEKCNPKNKFIDFLRYQRE